ncbi:SMP-30/gluconolactonase/LRE family protein [Mucilaginibacter conchicola]|uniref:SMP-30/gluconolactonase/LRE family protein n=1 Tax=Mucilaginibacter conchicola TaxID=2303333 RepID=A0A372NVU6_9SPHI|nr:SMP-30/gluconolactonase/LRE family protein [Mucilaginibacter conchicola]RFZ94258.1 SMP-30/gluconolactonase/LRE family protein [Mucilaginibacter conchicola]
MRSLLIFLCFCSLSAFAQTSQLFDAGAKPKLVSNQFEFTEGPAVDRQGNIYFTDQPHNKIWKYDTNGRLSVFMDKAGRANGTYFDTKGNLIACADEHNQLWQISPQKKVKVLLEDYEGKLFNGPNDLWIDKYDNIYFTDPYFQRDYWTRNKSEMSGEKVFLLRKGQNKPILLDSMVKPNGIVGTPDGKHLFVADIGAGKIYKYDIKPDGNITNKRSFFTETADGITLDEQGNLYLAGKGVTIINPKGEKISHIDISEPWTANLCFGGKGRRTLFITASKAVYVIRMKVRGVE